MFRWFIGARFIGTELMHVVRPKKVTKICFNKKILHDNVIQRVNGFIFLYIGIVFLGALALILTGIDLVEALSASISAIGNVGPAIGSLGPSYNYAEVSVAGKYILSFLMLVGRLEIYTVLVLFTPWLWRK